MREFALILLQSKVDSESDGLLRRVQQGSAVEVSQGLSELAGRAQRSNDPDAWNAAGLGFHYAGQYDQAMRIFDALVQSYPDHDVYRLNLATSYAQTEQFELCRHHLRRVAEHGSTEEFRRLGKEQLDGYERFLGLTEADQKLRDLQINSLRRAISDSERTPENFIALARLLLLCGKVEPGGDWLSQATAVLEQGREVFPREKEMLELLVTVYLRDDPQERLPEILSRLEKIAPNSAVLESLVVRDEEAAAFTERMLQRANELMRRAIESKDDNDIREAALHDLGRIVATYPQNSGYRLIYAFTLMGVERRDAALQEAQKLAGTPNDSHSFHFNLGQIFWICGDPIQGRRHLDLAARYAQNEQERQDVRDRIAGLER
jgi:tetratricopeptide (TPR) repeat protein